MTVKNEDIKVSSFIPPQLFKRYNAFSHFTYKARQSNKDLKTQIRLGDKDIILLLKMKGEKDWTTKDISFFGELPEIESYKNWPSRPMPEIISPAKGRDFTRKKKNV